MAACCKEIYRYILIGVFIIKILVISDASHVGGAEYYIKNLVHLFKEDKEYDFVVYGNDALNSILKINNTSVFTNSKPFKTILNFLKVLFKERPDVIHLNLTYPFSCFWIQVLALFLFRHRFVATLHIARTYKKKRLLNSFLKLIYKRIKIILVAEAAKEELYEFYGIRNKEIQVIPNWVDTKKFHSIAMAQKLKIKEELDIDIKAKVALFVGRFEEQKNIIELIKASEKLINSDKDWIIVLVGEGSQLNMIKQKSRELGIQENLMIFPFNDNPHKFYSIADVFLLLSKYECAPLTLLEAMSCGIPPVVTDVGDMRRMVNDSEVICNSNLSDIVIRVQRAIGHGPVFWKDIIKENYTPLIAKKNMTKVYANLKGVSSK
ncbi:glycosyltransferase family 4 protein [Terribacillus saccharophilus]|uniref:glycosyltransferase family 4 protein n=1 Tax=Terribacillus saccharophilus TaxID=361277 RepID=UPI000C99EAAC|nr:glycosyltransferase family 4 protein [Terribacillus goriensis]